MTPFRGDPDPIILDEAMRRASIEWAIHSAWSDLTSLRAITHHSLADLSFRRWLTRHHVPYHTAAIQPLIQPDYEHPIINRHPCFVSASCRTLPHHNAFWGQARDIPRHPFPICVDMPAVRRALHICIILIRSDTQMPERDRDPTCPQPVWLTLIPHTDLHHEKPVSAYLVLDQAVPLEGQVLIKHKGTPFAWLPFSVQSGKPHELPPCFAIKALHTDQLPGNRLLLHHRDQSIVITPQSWHNIWPSFHEAFFAGWMDQRDVLQFTPGTLMARERGFRSTVSVPLSQLKSPSILMRVIRQGWG